MKGASPAIAVLLVFEAENTRRVYSEHHPDVVRLRRIIDELTREALESCVEELQ